MNQPNRLSEAIVGCLLGTAIGDGLGLPLEGIPRHRQRRLCADVGSSRLLPRRLMISDDTEHACLTAIALAISAGETAPFSRSMAGLLKRWFLALPAGTGMATARACIRLLLGVGPERSGVFSAGNGPAMRSPIIGVCFADEPARMRQLVGFSTRITHTDPKAEHGALAVAIAAGLAAQANPPPDTAHCLLESFQNAYGRDAQEFCSLLESAASSAATNQTTEDFAARIGCGNGVSGYIYHTVPVAIHAWLAHRDSFASAITSVIRCGGDTDTTGAIVGGIIGAAVGKEGIPREWLSDLHDWPRTAEWIEQLGCRVAAVVESSEPQAIPDVRLGPSFARNLVFLCVVLGHGFRRLLPPY